MSDEQVTEAEPVPADATGFTADPETRRLLYDELRHRHDGQRGVSERLEGKAAARDRCDKTSGDPKASRVSSVATTRAVGDARVSSRRMGGAVVNLLATGHAHWPIRA